MFPLGIQLFFDLFCSENQVEVVAFLEGNGRLC
jgi:hypothetical protein